MHLKTTSTILGLAVGSALTLSTMPAKAATVEFGNNGILFDTDTQIDFDFIRSQGAFKSTLFIVEAANPTDPVFTLFKENEPFDDTSPDFIGTCPTSVTVPGSSSCTNLFTFEAGIEYSLALFSGNNKPAGTNGFVYSTDALNTPANRQAFVFDGVVLPPYTEPGEGSSDPALGKVTIAFDDKGGGNDGDFQDFIITAMETKESIPEPATLAALGLVAGSLTLIRRRQR
ncbi:MAG: PEP-CTERM sorting domain-containing protein [Coleofasciculus sp. G1-WW12-02]|uniref:PEP-CTERM sorting domain-containing protein n=1 Tax=Coleofasciculus sp. G1-WW12-02 TaxID=3068483 RepID=UPI0032F5C499